LITSAISGSTALHAAQSTPLQSPDVEKTTADQGFESILKSLGTGAVEALRTGESTAIAALEGKASTQQAVMATMQAEQSLQAALAIRDKIVSAFLEISRMQI
jgi:flagellar hook-basal body complex protein FliE